jgi:predicted AAA+ superfamily ATPase
MILRPQYIEKIMAYADAPFVKILSGVRRCGKSTLLKMAVDKLRERGIPDDKITAVNLRRKQESVAMLRKLKYNYQQGVILWSAENAEVQNA